MVDNVLRSMGYKCIATIGEGTYAKVKLATSKKHQRNVAIKILDRDKNPDFCEKFLPRELAVIRRIHHENIIHVHEYFEVGRKYVCIVMEVAEKDLLQKIHEDKRIPKEQTKTWFSQMVSAVNYLHQLDIAHRDLKCENILLTTDGRVKICDFGFGRFMKESFERSHTFCGSAAYCSPEVLRNTPYDPKKYDVWSLGVILYTMITGLLPFDDTNMRQLTRLQEMPLVYPDNVDVEESCRAFIATLLQVNPSTRPTIQQVAEHPWLQVADSQHG
ncbi:testis-specific serine/threonine-protein kinase 6 [Triplophysa dalaica]|uniref:testis-specific serine/threonine-protein kinase 6 n=1 Tax=Triplophysa dalaica TaxID=1582913 RepID=UPI0024E01A90|nr:testis-specific serine/threonine-protein kinase 6 [Triplophysa dalaica]